MTLEGLALPDDVSRRGVCGVVALAFACGVTFERAEDALRRASKRCASKRWKGSTTFEERRDAARILGFECVQVVMRRMTLANYARRRAHITEPETVRVTGHVLTLLPGRMILDQQGIRHIHAARCARKFVTSVEMFAPL